MSRVSAQVHRLTLPQLGRLPLATLSEVEVAHRTLELQRVTSKSMLAASTESM